MSPDTASYLGLLVAIVGIPFAYWISRYFANRPQFEFTFDHEKILDGSESETPGAMIVQYEGEIVANLHRWKVGLWNSGNQPFDRTSFVETDPIALKIKGHRILDVQGRSSSRAAVSPEFFIVDGEAVELRFEICDRGDGFVFFIFTERLGQPATEDVERKAFSASGSLKGIPGGLRKSVHPSNLSRADFWGIFFFGIILLLGGITISQDVVSEIGDFLADKDYATL